MWTSCGEKLPKEYETVLVSTKGKVYAGEMRLPDNEGGPDQPFWMLFKGGRRSREWAGYLEVSTEDKWAPMPEAGNE